MAGCRIVNASVVTAVEAISKSATDYQNAGVEFVKALNGAISEMEGETKDALKKFIDTDVNKFVSEDLPAAITGMHDLLEANRTNFVDVDKKISDSISGS